MMVLRIAICGLGRTGLEVARLVREHPRHRLAAGFCRDGSPKAGTDLGQQAKAAPSPARIWEIGCASQVLVSEKIDVVIDFSEPFASLTMAQACRDTGVPIVICTTGFSREQTEHLRDLANSGEFGLVLAPNITLGVNVMMHLVEQVARSLPGYDFHITEMHHNQKKDTPSGTAAKISMMIERLLPGKKPKIHSIRAGGYVGRHDVLAAGDYDRILIIHESFSRRAFAQGALHTAEFIREKRGYYEMKDVLFGSNAAKE